MTTLDRAFIKAFADTAPGGAAQAPRAEAANPPRRPPVAAKAQPDVSSRAVPTAGEAVAGARISRPQPTAPLAPLSAFAGQVKIHEPFRAEVEVDRFSWTPACEDLFSRAKGAWSRFIDQLIERSGQGQKCIAIASAHRGEGRTTVSLALARHLATRGLRVVVVDADLESPNLARACGLSTYTSWGEVLQKELPLGEALVTAVDDGVTLMPWRGSAVHMAQLATSLRTATSFNLLRDHYEFVLLDTMPLVGQTSISDFASFARSIRLDAVYMVQDSRWTLDEQLAATCAKLRRSGLPVEGIIENFVSPTGRVESAAREHFRSAASPAPAASS